MFLTLVRSNVDRVSLRVHNHGRDQVLRRHTPLVGLEWSCTSPLEPGTFRRVGSLPSLIHSSVSDNVDGARRGEHGTPVSNQNTHLINDWTKRRTDTDDVTVVNEDDDDVSVGREA